MLINSLILFTVFFCVINNIKSVSKDVLTRAGLSASIFQHTLIFVQHVELGNDILLELGNDILLELGNDILLDICFFSQGRRLQQVQSKNCVEIIQKVSIDNTADAQSDSIIYNYKTSQ